MNEKPDPALALEQAEGVFTILRLRLVAWLKSQKKPRERPWYGGAVMILTGFMALGVIALFAYVGAAEKAASASYGSAFVLSGAGVLFGVFIGFLFGIPKTATRPSGDQAAAAGGSEKTTYYSNTNLEDISDWLTKIIVGLGLTQLTELPGHLKALGASLGPMLGKGAHAEILAAVAVVYFVICGFFVGFLWTRLTLEKLYRMAAAKEQAAVKGQVVAQ